MTLGLLMLTIVLYGLFWVALALLVNSLRRDSAFNAVALVMAWVLLVLVAPAAMNATAQSPVSVAAASRDGAGGAARRRDRR